MPPKRPRPLSGTETPRMSGALPVLGTAAPPTTPATPDPSPKRVRRRQPATISPPPGPSDRARTAHQSETFFVHQRPTTPTRAEGANIHIGGPPSPISPENDDNDEIGISSDHSSVADDDQAGHEPGDGFDEDEVHPYKRPKFSSSHARSSNVPLPARLAKVVPLARDEWDISRLILQGVGSGSEPVSSVGAGQAADADTQYSDEFLTGRATLYSDRPTDPDELETWKRLWVEEGLSGQISEFTRSEKAALQTKDEEEKARMLADAKEAGIDLTQEEQVAVRPRLRPLRRTGPPDFWVEEVDHEPNRGVESVAEDVADHTVERLERKGWEWSENTALNGVKQPPLGVRLEHILSLLQEEDRDRCLGWEDKVEEVEAFLAWVGLTYSLNDDDTQGEGRVVSAEVRNMYLDALRKLQVHRLFEEWQHETAIPPLSNPGEARKIASRRQPGWEVQRDAAAHFRFVPRQQEHELEPRKMLVTKPLRVNTLHPAGSHEGKVLQAELESAGSQFWEHENSDPRTNLYMIEDAAYRAYNVWKEGHPTNIVDGERLIPDPKEIKRLNKDNVVDVMGRVPVDTAMARDEALKMDFGSRPKPRWMTDDEYVELTAEVERLERTQTSPEHAVDDTDPDSESGTTDHSMSPDEMQIIADESSSDGRDGHRYTFDDLRRQAEIRGTRRAALQEALRFFTTAPQASAQTKFTTLIPAIEQRYIDAIVKDLDRNHQYLSSKATQTLALENEPMPYTVFWRLYRKQMQKWSAKALKEVTLEHAQDSAWVDIPRNIVCGGPFVQQSLSPRAEKDQSLLKRCETALQAITQAVERTGSQLLSDVRALAMDVVEEGIDPVLLPDIVDLRGDEIYGQGGAMSVKLLSPDEVKWLLFMTGQAVNEKMLQPRSKKKLRLYNIFVQRLQKLMCDRSEFGLFPKKESTATVEELLETMNAACHGPVERTIFTPFQAKFFLERACEQGLCTYRPDLLVYGIVRRSEQTIFPWDHIVFDEETTASSVRSPVSDPTHDQDIKGHISQIFRNLGYRLGVTINSLRQSEPAQPEEHLKPKILLTLPKIEKTLTMSVDAYGSTLANLVKTYETSHLEKTGVPRSLSLISLISNARPSDANSPAMYFPPHARSAEAYLRDINNPKDHTTEIFALHHIRRQLILESYHNLPLLSRSRPSFLTTSSGEVVQANNTWDHNWDWASPSVRGPVRQFFNVNRWPLNFQSPTAQHRIKSDEEIDERYLIDVDAEDPIPKQYFRLKLRPYGEEDDEGERVFRPGTPQFWDGDTISQQKYVRRLLEERIGDALGIPPRPLPKPRTWVGRLAAALTPWKEDEKKERPDSPWDKNLPKVHWRLMPKSIDPWNPVVESSMRKSAGMPERRLGGDVGDIDMVDVY